MAFRNHSTTLPMIHQYRRLTGLIAAWAVAVIFLSWLANSVPAQQPKFEALPIADPYVVTPLSPDADEDEEKDHRRANSSAMSAIKDGERAAEDLLKGGGDITGAASRAFFDDYVFPAMTQLDPATLSTLGQQREQFLKNYLDDNIGGAARQSIINLTIEGMQKIYTNPALHPSARLNAVYLVGLLDDVPAIRIQDQMPTPSAKALSNLEQIVTSNDESQFPVYLKIAALAGIQRHAEVASVAGRTLDPATKNAIVAKINSTLSQPVDPANAAVGYWLKRRAVQIGGLIGDVTTVNQIIQTLKSPDEKFWLQVDALAALDAIGTQNISAEQNSEAATVVTEFIARALDRESKGIKASVDKLVFNNLLFADLDLEVVGTTYDDEAAAEIGEGGGDSGGGGGADSGGGKFGGGLGGMGASGPGEGASAGGGRGGGGAGQVTADPKEPKLELPNYELQSSRSRIKALAFLGRSTIGDQKDQGLRRYLDANGEKFANIVVAELKTLLDNSTIGIIDREKKTDPNDAAESTETYTQQLIDLCEESSVTLREHITDFTGVPAQPDKADASTGAAGGAAEAGGL